MKVLFVTSEAFPFAASGGLADVAYALPKALRTRLVGCRVVLPLYKSVDQKWRDNMKFVCSFSVPVSWRRQYCGVFEAKYGGVTYYLLDNQYYFNRDGFYDHYDNAERFAFLSRAAIEMLEHIDFKPDIIHANDWQCALTPIYYHLFYSFRPEYQGIKTVFTIHNIQYQGQYGKEIIEDVFGIPASERSLIEYNGCVNLMKGGIECADFVTTVSPAYAEEILTPWFSHKLDAILSHRRYKLMGILNGIDNVVYDPETDQSIYKNYSVTDLSGKAANKAGLQAELGLPDRPEVPLMGMVTRLVEHKGLDLIKTAIHGILKTDLQMVVLGSGDWAFEDFFRKIAEQYPDKFRLYLGFFPDMARKIYAGSDLFLMPSKSEPCGLSQMVALRYGTIPIVRSTGGLKDSVQDSGDNEGNGFAFLNYDPDDMAYAIQRAVTGYYADQPGWQLLQKRAMEADNSWSRSAGEYIKLYKRLQSGR